MDRTDRRRMTSSSVVEQWGRFEVAFTAGEPVADPTHDVDLLVTFTAPSGVESTVRGFWDGADVWRVRFCPDEQGGWTWHTQCDGEHAGLHDQQGSFECVPATAEHRFARRGAVGVSADGHHLAHADGVPFFCLGDTVWSGPQKATLPDWDVYLRDRVEKGFTTALVTVDRFQGNKETAEGEVAFHGRKHIAVNPAYYQRIDPFIDALNDAGLFAVLMFLHAGHTTPLNSALSLPEDEAITLGRYIVARYGAHHAMWDVLAEAYGDPAKTESYRRIGRAVFDRNPGKPVTLHPPGAPFWALDDFADEDWMTVLGYQSAHGETDMYWNFIINGPPSTDWERTPHRPVMNLEPPYEDHRSFSTGKRFGPEVVRLGCWSSLLATAVSGVTYGGQGVWDWNDGKHMAFRHRNTGRPKAWWDALQLPGATSMRHLAECMVDLEWWTLRPAQDLIAEQPGEQNVRHSIIAASSVDRALLVAYLPQPSPLVLHAAGFGAERSAQWFNPRTGVRTPAEVLVHDGTLRAEPPGEDDWVFVLRARR